MSSLPCIWESKVTCSNLPVQFKIDGGEILKKPWISVIQLRFMRRAEKVLYLYVYGTAESANLCNTHRHTGIHTQRERYFQRACIIRSVPLTKINLLADMSFRTSGNFLISSFRLFCVLLKGEANTFTSIPGAFQSFCLQPGALGKKEQYHLWHLFCIPVVSVLKAPVKLSEEDKIRKDSNSITELEGRRLQGREREKQNPKSSR